MPILDIEDAVDVKERIDEFFAARPERRPDVLRRLFVEILDFQASSGQLALTSAATGVQLPDHAERIAELDGVRVLFAPLDTRRINKREAADLARIVERELGDRMLLLLNNDTADQLHLIYPRFDGGSTPKLQRLIFERDGHNRTSLGQTANLYQRYQQTHDLMGALKEAFDVGPITDKFFEEYRRIFRHAERVVRGFEPREAEHRKQFVQTLFNRLMFVYFLSRKGWLKFDGDTDYLNALWADYERSTLPTNFYDQRLYHLFFFALNNSQGRDFNLNFVDSEMRDRLGKVPFLNGGLFEETKLDKRSGITVPDNAIQPLLTELFDKFNFTVMESTPFDIEVAVDPEMLGKVFERLITDRHEKGSYYTPRPVVSFMCREALKGYLEAKIPALDAEATRRFVEQHDLSAIAGVAPADLLRALDEVTVVDPACGSGAYLVGMMQELVELQNALFDQKAIEDTRTQYQMKLKIIERSLYGADIDRFAKNIAMLRLWLSLAIEYEGHPPHPALPNLDFKILEGDSLLGPDPSETGQQGVLGYDGNSVNELRDLKSRYMTESQPRRKTQLREAITEAETTIREQLSHFADTDNALDWRIDFAEVIADGGFDIALANPPYVKAEHQSDNDRTALQKHYGWSADLYEYFIARGIELISSTGMISYIANDSFVTFSQKQRVRTLILENSLHILARTPPETFDATVYAAILVASRDAPGANHTYLSGGFSYPDFDFDYYGEVPYRTVQRLPGHRLLLSPDYELLVRMMSYGKVKEICTVLDAGIHSGNVRDRIFFKHRRHGLERLLQGRQIDRYSLQWDSARAQYKFVDIKYEPRPVPGIGRGGKPSKKNEYWTLKNHGRDHRHSERLLMRQTGDDLVVAYQNEDRHGRYYTDNTLFTILPLREDVTLKFLCGVLNSSLVRYVYRSLAQETGKTLAQVKVNTVNELPIALGNGQHRKSVESLVDLVIDAKDSSPETDTSEWEREIDRLVYDLYGLTEEEIAAVEKGGMSR